MNHAQIALARSRAYSLFSHLALDGLTPEILPVIQELPDLPLSGQSLADAASAHYCLFGLTVFPFQSVFLSADGLLGGVENERVLRSYIQVGYMCPDPRAAEHLGWQLACLAFLCGAEADAWEDGRTAMALHAARLQGGFLGEHLLRWLPPLVSAIRRQPDRFYGAFADLLLNLAAEHAAAVVADQSSSSLWQLAGEKLSLDDAKTTLRDIAHWLTAPANSGFFLSRDEIGRLARLCDLPAGFGDRSHMLGELLHTAAHYDRFNHLWVALGQLIESHRDAYDAWTCDLPALARWAAPWRDRISVTLGLVARLGAQVNL